MTGRYLKPSSQKLGVYETLHLLNQGFERVLEDLRRLQEVPFSRRPLLRVFQLVVEETRGWANFELVEVMHEREQSDWAKLGVSSGLPGAFLSPCQPTYPQPRSISHNALQPRLTWFPKVLD